MGNLNDIISQSLLPFKSSELLTKSKAQKQVQLTVELDDSLPEFSFDPIQIKRVMTNLLDNSFMATEGRKNGKVEIKSEYDSLLKIVKITVEDNGKGIPKKMINQIFEPYVTTKKNGTGLGLAIVKKTIEDHNGFIRAFDVEPEGTKFIIELPVLEEKVIRNFDLSIESTSSKEQDFD